MKKLKNLLFALMALGAVSSASAGTATVNVDDPTHVKCADSNSGAEIPLVQGANVFDCSNGTLEYTFTTVDPWAFESIIADWGDTGTEKGTKIWIAYIDEDEEYTITTYNAAGEVKTTFSLWVDNAAAVRMLCPNPYAEIDLKNGDNTIDCGESGAFYYIYKRNYDDKDIYSVKKNGNAIADNYGNYEFNAQPGDAIDIQTEWPDEDATVKFTYSPGGKGCISDVKVDNEPVENFDGETLTVKLGSKLTINQAANWTVTSFTENDVTKYFYSGYQLIVKGDTELHFVAEYVDPYVTLNINVDRDDAVETSYYSYTTYSDVTQILKAGDNAVKVENNKTLTFKALAPYGFKEILDLDNNTTLSVNSGSAYAYITGAKNYKITTFNEEEARTATAIFNIDKIDNVSVRRESDSYSFPELKEGKNEIKFNPETETSFMVTSMSNVPLWEVKLNGQNVEARYGSYYITLTDGCTVDITATIPDIDITATFDITDEDAAANLITGVKVNDEDVTLTGNTLSMKAGQSLYLSFSNLYKIDSFMMGDKSENYVGSYYDAKVLMADTKFTIAAHKLATIKVKVIVDDPENITIGNGFGIYQDPKILTDLTAGTNELEIPETNTGICWQINDGCELVSVKHNGVEENLLANTGKYISMADGDEIEFTTRKIAYDKTAIIWIDNREAANQYFNFVGNRSGDSKSIDAATGYTEFNFRDAMLPMNLSWYGENAKVGKVYINNESVDPQYEGSTTYELNFGEGDVIKLFLATEPVESKLSFDVEEGVTVNATTDRIVPVADLTKEQTVFNGTEVVFTIEAGNDELEVKNGEAALAPGEDGNYLVVVNGDTALSVKKLVKDGIHEISTPSLGHSDTIYDLQGRRINKPARGLYIINGKKTLVK